MCDEPQQVVLRVGRNRHAAWFLRGRGRFLFPRQTLEAPAERVCRGAFRGVRMRRIKRPVQLHVDVDMGLEGERRIEHRLHALLAELGDRRFDAVGLGRGVLDDVGAGHLLEAGEELIVPREVRVAQHVRNHERVFRERIVVHQVGMARVAGKHDFEDARMAHAAADQLVHVTHAERPVRHPHRQPVDRDFHHERRRNDIEIHRVVVETEFAGERLDARHEVGNGGHQAVSDCAACCWKNSRSAVQMSSWRAPC